MRCEAVRRSGAETEPSEPLSKPGSVEAPGRQGGVPLFQQRCEAPSNSESIMWLNAPVHYRSVWSAAAASALGKKTVSHAQPTLVVGDLPHDCSGGCAACFFSRTRLQPCQTIVRVVGVYGFRQGLGLQGSRFRALGLGFRVSDAPKPSLINPEIQFLYYGG